MSKEAVREILRQIEALDDKDILRLELELAKLQQREWEKETAKARKIARSRGITQDVIDRIIERRRYGR